VQGLQNFFWDKTTRRRRAPEDHEKAFDEVIAKADSADCDYRTAAYTICHRKSRRGVQVEGLFSVTARATPYPRPAATIYGRYYRALEGRLALGLEDRTTARVARAGLAAEEDVVLYGEPLFAAAVRPAARISLIEHRSIGCIRFPKNIGAWDVRAMKLATPVQLTKRRY